MSHSNFHWTYLPSVIQTADLWACSWPPDRDRDRKFQSGTNDNVRTTGLNLKLLPQKCLLLLLSYATLWMQLPFICVMPEERFEPTPDPGEPGHALADVIAPDWQDRGQA